LRARRQSSSYSRRRATFLISLGFMSKLPLLD
jgi:hypothetical protein